jgi:hypothetical protein
MVSCITKGGIDMKANSPKKLVMCRLADSIGVFGYLLYKIPTPLPGGIFLSW